MESPVDPRPDVAGLSLLVPGSYNPRIHRLSIWRRWNKSIMSRLVVKFHRKHQTLRETYHDFVHAPHVSVGHRPRFRHVTPSPESNPAQSFGKPGRACRLLWPNEPPVSIRLRDVLALIIGWGNLGRYGPGASADDGGGCLPVHRRCRP